MCGWQCWFLDKWADHGDCWGLRHGRQTLHAAATAGGRWVQAGTASDCLHRISHSPFGSEG